MNELVSSTAKKTTILPIKDSSLSSSSPIYSCQLDGKGKATAIDLDGEATVQNCNGILFL